MIHTLRANSASFRFVRTARPSASCEQRVLRTTNVPPSVIMLWLVP
jgi:hypothetical protein